MAVGKHHQRLHRRHAHNQHPAEGPHNNEVKDMNLQPRDGGVATFISVVYVTAKPTFDGPVQGYSTVGDVQLPSPAQPSDPPSPTPAVNTPSPAPPAPSSDRRAPKPTPSPSPSSDTDGPSSTDAPSSVIASTNTPAIASSAAATVGASSLVSGSIAAASASSSVDPSAVPQDQGLSGGAKAGIAIGVLLAVALIVVAAFMYIRNKKSRENHAIARAMEAEEKNNPFGDNAAAPAPVVGGSIAAGAGMAAVGGAAAATAYGSRPQSRPITQLPDLEKAGATQSGAPSNPFGSGAETRSPDSPNPFTSPPSTAPGATNPAIPSSSAGTGAGLAAGAAAGAVAAGALGAAAARKNGPPKPLNMQDRLHSPNTAVLAAADRAVPSPTASQFSANSMTSSAIAAGTPSTNVHRVQLDFKPSMDDELELQAGQLVRLLHEYDDGWALCIRLDRSQQGVVPRTCLSTRPVKPRTGPPKGMPPHPAAPANLRPGTAGSAQAPLSRHDDPIDRAGSPAPLFLRAGSPAPNGMPKSGPSPALQPRAHQRSRSNGTNGPAGPRMKDEARRRSNSVGDVSKVPKPVAPGPAPAAPESIPRVESPNPSVTSSVARKPVPGRS